MVPKVGTNTDLSQVTTRAVSQLDTADHYAGDRADLIPVTTRGRHHGHQRRGLAWGRSGRVRLGRPKGMHRRTYERLCDEHDTFEHAVNLSFRARFGPMLKKGGF